MSKPQTIWERVVELADADPRAAIALAHRAAPVAAEAMVDRLNERARVEWLAEMADPVGNPPERSNA
jgi:hypothetical protein